MSYDDMPQKQARIEALREEKGRLQKVRQTIAFYEANAASGKVKKAVLPQMAQQIQPAEGAKYSTNGAGKALDRGLMRWKKYFCTDRYGNEPVHYNTGICKDQYAHHRYWCSDQYYP